MLSRPDAVAEVRAALRRSRIVALVGPRQCGKTTLARGFVAADSLNYFDLESPVSLGRLAEPMAALQRLNGLVVIDEIQHRPDLFPVLRVLADRRPMPARFLILGSASPELLRQSSESLAGRMQIVTMSGFTLDEVGSQALDRHWLRGGFPEAFLASSDSDSFAWRRQFIQTFLERDVPQFGVSIPATTLMRFWNMVAHMHGSIWSSADPARSMGVSEPAIRRYLDLLTGLFMLRQLQPWHENLGKRQVKSPKVYFRDSGLLHALLGLRTQRETLGHPRSGASWEGYILEQVLKVAGADEAYFWATHQGAELDLLLMKGGRRLGVEIKYADAPQVTPSMRIALGDLKLERLLVVYPGETSYPLADNIDVFPAASLASLDTKALWRKSISRRGRRRTQ